MVWRRWTLLAPRDASTLPRAVLFDDSVMTCLTRHGGTAHLRLPCLRVCAFARVCVGLRACLCMLVRVCVFAHLHVRVGFHARVRVCVRMLVCVCARACVRVCASVSSRARG
jgi:hypothetical protein